MNDLININAGQFYEPEPEPKQGMESGETSVFRYREVTHEFKGEVATRGATWGFFTAIGVGLLVFLPVYFAGVLEGNFPINVFRISVAGWIFTGIMIGMAVTLKNLELESNEGYLKISDNYVEYWTGRGAVKLLTSEIFGTGPVKLTFRRKTRFYFLSNVERGYGFKDKSFKHYVPASGPAKKVGIPDMDGDDMVRGAMIEHIKQRLRQKLRVAELPAYQFTAVQTHRKNLLYGDTVVDAIFECDGKTIFYKNKDEEYKIPVRSVKDVKVREMRSKHGRTAYYVDLYVEPSISLDKIIINILRMPKPEEIDKYCRTFPTLFPLAEDGYWN